MRPLLDHLIRRCLRIGRLTVRWPDGAMSTYGDLLGPEVAVTLHDRATIRRLALHPELALGEAYMDGTLEPLQGSVFDLLDVLMSNRGAGHVDVRLLRLHRRLRRLRRVVATFTPAARAVRNAAHHYDLNGRLYSLFLDRDRQYSCAYFRTGTETLEQAQAEKKRHVAAKLLLDRPDLAVLDIGSGWGGLALTLAREHGARVTGITLSHEQLQESRARAAAEGLADRVQFQMLDYRAVGRVYDRIVSVGMFEHVGVNHYGQFFAAVRRCLAPDGVALLHAIDRSNGPAVTNPWFAKYIFPGGYAPALSEVLPGLERAGLVATDIEILRLHYAETLRHWRRRFAASRDAIAALADERFCRMFEFYLAGSELAFRREHHMVFQIQIARDQRAVPLTRDYLARPVPAMAAA